MCDRHGEALCWDMLRLNRDGPDMMSDGHRREGMSAQERQGTSRFI